MKTILLLSLAFALNCQSAFRYTFNFDTKQNPSPSVDTNKFAVVTVGQYAAGWIQSLYIGGTATGMYELGPLGSIQVGIPKTEVLTVTVRYYQDGGLFNIGPTVTAAQLSSVSTTETSEPTGTKLNGRWVTSKSIWKVVPETTVVVASPKDMPHDALVDSVTIDCQTEQEALSTKVAEILIGIKAQAQGIVNQIDALMK